MSFVMDLVGLNYSSVLNKIDIHKIDFSFWNKEYDQYFFQGYWRLSNKSIHWSKMPYFTY